VPRSPPLKHTTDSDIQIQNRHSAAHEPKRLIVSVLPHGAKVLAILPLVRQNSLSGHVTSMIRTRRHGLEFRIRVRI